MGVIAAQFLLQPPVAVFQVLVVKGDLHDHETSSTQSEAGVVSTLQTVCVPLAADP